MAESVLKHLESASGLITLFAVAVIIIGFVLAWVRYTFRFQKLTRAQNFQKFKVDLGSTLLLGLEILVLADVIDTILVEPTFASLLLLACIVVVRTVVSWTLTLQTEGRWPWQPSLEEPDRA